MPSQVDFANFALGLVAEQRITSIDNDTEPARLCKLHLAETTREVLRAGLWRCAFQRATLTQDSPAPNFGWTYSYALPVDWLRTVSFNDTDPEDVERWLFEVESGHLLTDESTAKIVYVADVTTQSGGAGYNQLDPLCARAVYTLLASKLAFPLQQAVALKTSLLEEYERIIAKAAAVNARDAFSPLVNRLSQSSWIRARSVGV
jgi:hypothetical protein